MGGKVVQFDQQPCILVEGNSHAVPAHRLDIVQRVIERPALGPVADAGLEQGADILRRPHEHLGIVGVENHRIARLDPAEAACDPADDGNIHRTGHDGRMGGRRTLLQDDAGQAVRIVIQQFGRAQIPGEHDHPFGVRHAGRGRCVAGGRQMLEQAIAQIVEIGHPRAQIGILDRRHAGTGRLLDLGDRGFRGETLADRLADAMQPAPVLGDQAVGLEDLPALGTAFQPVVSQHDVQRIVHRRQGGLEPLQFEFGIFRHDVDDGRAVAMHDRFAGRRPAVQLQPGQPQRQQRNAVGLAQFVQADQIARPDHLGHDHGHGLERLDLFVRIMAPGAVLDGQDADDAAVAQYRHAHHRMVDFLAGFRPVGETGMGLGVGERNRPGTRGDVADHAFADAQAGLVHRRLVQALGGVEFQHVAGAPQVQRTHLGDHVGRDQGDDPVETLLAGDRPGAGHDIADTPQQPPDIRQPAGRQPRRRAYAVGRSGQFGHGGCAPLSRSVRRLLPRPARVRRRFPRKGRGGRPTLRRGRKPNAGRAAPVRYIPRRSGRSP